LRRVNIANECMSHLIGFFLAYCNWRLSFVFCKYKITKKENIFSFFPPIRRCYSVRLAFQETSLNNQETKFSNIKQQQQKKIFQSSSHLWNSFLRNKMRWDWFSFLFKAKSMNLWGFTCCVNYCSCVLPSFLLCSSHPLIQKDEKKNWERWPQNWGKGTNQNVRIWHQLT
jgi:hypothetical protein